MFVLSLSDWQHAIVLIAAVIIIVAIMAFIGWRFTLYLEHKRNRDRKAFVHDVITGNHSDEQVIRFMASPIGPRMDVRLIHAVAGSSRMTPKIRKWIFKHYPVALASQPDLSSDEIIELSELDERDVDYRLLTSGADLPLKAIRNIADTTDIQIIHVLRNDKRDFLKDNETDKIVEKSIKNIVGF